jgi:hypothetical protein
MWQLSMKAPADNDWVVVDTFETVSAAARRIRELEGRTEGGVFLTALFEIDFGDDAEALGHLEHTGKRALYVIKRRMN